MNRILKVLMFLFALSCKSVGDLELENILGIKPVSLDKEFHKEDLISYSGEGFSIIIITIGEEDIKNFLRFEDKYKFPKFEPNDSVRNWKKGPFPFESEKAIIEPITSYYVRDPKVKGYQKEVIELLKKENIYYAYSSKMVLNNVVSVIFYLVDIDKQRVFLMENKI